ncbi:hypothetical protein niasHT_026373 [Heterodera trifolii]|uniref:Uncharacterized protein n=1 Tax=Heterodera trifolii TaxID=157864 RepID=A0ABD2KPS3_9BILA
MSTISSDQLDKLESAFKIRMYLNADEQRRLGKEIGLTEEQINEWFEQRRKRWRKEFSCDNQEQSPQNVDKTEEAEQKIVSQQQDISTDQLDKLGSEFEKRKCLSASEGEKLAKEIVLTEMQEKKPQMLSADQFAVQSECATVWEPLNLRQEWTISNFAKALELATPGICMRGEKLWDASMPYICWQLCLYPGGKREANSGNVSLFLKMSTAHWAHELTTVRAEYHFFFVDEHGTAKFSNVNTADFNVQPSKSSRSWGLRNIPHKKAECCLWPDQSLHIVCEIKIVPDFSKVTTTGVHNRRRHDQSQMTKHHFDRFHQMFLSGDGTDCVIEFGTDQQFRVHKFVLMAHSEVFRAMFTHKNETTQSAESRVRITDCKPIVVHQMLTYMYSGRLPDTFDNDHAQELIEIAEKYGLEPMKIICQDRLSTRKLENELDMLKQPSLTDVENCANGKMGHTEKQVEAQQQENTAVAGAKVCVECGQRIVHQTVPPIQSQPNANAIGVASVSCTLVSAVRGSAKCRRLFWRAVTFPVNAVVKLVKKVRSSNQIEQVLDDEDDDHVHLYAEL